MRRVSRETRKGQRKLTRQTYLVKKGTALNKFNMNHASVLEAGLRDTNGGG
jgi:hypothetical protein